MYKTKMDRVKSFIGEEFNKEKREYFKYIDTKSLIKERKRS